ncbi:MAG: MFS transporter [Paludibacter sp.]
MLKSNTKQGLLLRMVYVLFFIQAGTWFSLFALFLERNGLSGFESGIIMGIIPAVMLLVMPFWGMVADKLGHKNTLLITALLTCFCFFLFVANTGFWYFLISTVILSLVYNPTMNSLLDSIALDYVDTHKTTNYGNFRIFGSIGYAAGGLLVGRLMTVYLINPQDMKFIFIFASALLFVGWFLLLFLKQETKPVKHIKESIFVGLKPIFKDKDIVGFLILNAFVAVSIQSVWSYYTVYLNNIGASDQTVGVGIMIQALVELPFYPIAYFIIKKFGLVRAISISIFATALRLFLYATISHPIFALGIECLQGLSFILNLLAAIEYLNIAIPIQYRATGQALFATTYMGVGAIVGNWWAGYLVDAFGVQRMFLINAGIICITFFFSFFIKNRRYEYQKI